MVLIQRMDTIRRKYSNFNFDPSDFSSASNDDISIGSDSQSSTELIEQLYTASRLSTKYDLTQQALKIYDSQKEGHLNGYQVDFLLGLVRELSLYYSHGDIIRSSRVEAIKFSGWYRTRGRLGTEMAFEVAQWWNSLTDDVVEGKKKKNGKIWNCCQIS